MNLSGLVFIWTLSELLCCFSFREAFLSTNRLVSHLQSAPFISPLTSSCILFLPKMSYGPHSKRISEKPNSHEIQPIRLLGFALNYCPTGKWHHEYHVQYLNKILLRSRRLLRHGMWYSFGQIPGIGLNLRHLIVWIASLFQYLRYFFGMSQQECSSRLETTVNHFVSCAHFVSGA